LAKENIEDLWLIEPENDICGVPHHRAFFISRALLQGRPLFRWKTRLLKT
jgi:hypothetical protein